MVGHNAYVLPTRVQKCGNPIGQTIQFFRDLTRDAGAALVP